MNLICKIDKINYRKLKDILYNPQFDINIQDNNGETFLHLFCEHYFNKYNFNIILDPPETGNDPKFKYDSNIMKVFDLIMNHPKININIQNSFNNTAFHILNNNTSSSLYNIFNSKILKTFISHKSFNPMIQNNYGDTPFHVFISIVNTTVLPTKVIHECLDMFFNYPNFDLYCKNFRMQTIFDLADIHLIKILIMHPKIPITAFNIPTTLNRTVFHNICSMYGNDRNILKLFLNTLKNINKQDYDGNSPFHMFFNNGNLEFQYYNFDRKYTKNIDLFLKHPNIDIGCTNVYGYTPFHYFCACKSSTISQLKMFLNHKTLKINLKTIFYKYSAFHLYCLNPTYTLDGLRYFLKQHKLRCGSVDLNNYSAFTAYCKNTNCSIEGILLFMERSDVIPTNFDILQYLSNVKNNLVYGSHIIMKHPNYITHSDQKNNDHILLIILIIMIIKLKFLDTPNIINLINKFID
jgi:ankyrin repeat protein